MKEENRKRNCEVGKYALEKRGNSHRISDVRVVYSERGEGAYLANEMCAVCPLLYG